MAVEVDGRSEQRLRALVLRLAGDDRARLAYEVSGLHTQNPGAMANLERRRVAVLTSEGTQLMSADAPPLAPRPAPRQDPVSRQFLAGSELVPIEHLGRPAVRVAVRLTDYRSLPASCIAGIDLSIDGREIDPESLVLGLYASSYPLAELRDRVDLVWFVLDPAQLVVPLEATLEPGMHELVGSLHLIMPYATVGRVVRSSTSHVRLPLAEPAPLWS